MGERIIQDRGRTLEAQWESICVGTSLKGTLSHSFAELAAGERAGWRPSLVVTPTIVELGRRLLISNLDFHSSDQGTLCNGIQFFTLFPDRADIRRGDTPQIARQKVVESLRLSTAIRMNAAFPMITPVLPLPVKSHRILRRRRRLPGELRGRAGRRLDRTTRNGSWMKPAASR